MYERECSDGDFSGWGTFSWPSSPRSASGAETRGEEVIQRGKPFLQMIDHFYSDSKML